LKPIAYDRNAPWKSLEQYPYFSSKSIKCEAQCIPSQNNFKYCL